MKSKKINIKTITIIVLIGIIISLIFTILNMKNKNIIEPKIEKEQLEELAANNAYIALSTHMNELDDKEDKLLSFKTQISDYIGEAGGVKPEYTADTVTFGESIKGIVKEVTKDATATVEDIAEGKKAWVNGEIITGIASNVNNLELTNTGSFKTGQTITLGYKPKVLITVGTFSGDSSIRFCYYNESISTSTYKCISSKNFFDKGLGEGSSNYLDTINNDGFTYGPGSNGSVSGTYYAYK